MGLDHSLVGEPSEPQERSWDSKDALLYAVGVGAGLGDPLQELEFTTENCEGIEQKVLPTFGVLIAQARPGRTLGDYDRAMLVHAEQAFELHRPLPVEGTVRTTATVTGIYDTGGSSSYTSSTYQGLVFVGYDGTFDPAAVIKIVRSHLKSSRVVDPGAHGGQMACGYNTTAADASECVWVTKTTFGVVEFIRDGQTAKQSGASALALKVRQAVEVKG